MTHLLISALLSVLVLAGISMMSRVKTAVSGNLLSALALLLGVVVTMLWSGVLTAWTLWPSLAVGALIGGVMARRVKMIQMPQTVALFNGLGGGASALVGVLSALGIGMENVPEEYVAFVQVTALLAVAIGVITLVGSLVAAGKLHRVLNGRPIVWPLHSAMTLLTIVITVVMVGLGAVACPSQMALLTGVTALASALFGLLFSVRVGGADMPITISLLNSLSGVAGAIAGMAISDIFLVCVGAIVGASGLLLTQIMCRAMNRSLASILLGGKRKKAAAPAEEDDNDPELIQRIMNLQQRITELEALVSSLEERVAQLDSQIAAAPAKEESSLKATLTQAKDVIIVPGYGMALAQAQHKVKQLADTFEQRGARVRYAIHPVAGRMPGHMNVLLAEADVSYDQLFEMEAIDDDFAKADLVVVIGANDVMNPAARNAEGTPIYGMPVLSVDKAKHIIICNFDLKPGYAGVENPLYSRKDGVTMLLGDAKESLAKLLGEMN